MTGLSDFLKVLETYFLTKLAQILGKFLWYFKNHHFFVKNCFCSFLVKIGLLLFKHLVTLYRGLVIVIVRSMISVSFQFVNF